MSEGCLSVVPNLGALPETCANFAWLYGYEPDPGRHIKVHAAILARAINSYWKDETQGLLKMQKQYYDVFYSWNLRINQWTQLLKAMKSGIEERKNDNGT